MATPTRRHARRPAAAALAFGALIGSCRLGELLQAPAAAPAAPAALAQLRSDGTTPIAAGGWAEERSVVLQGTVADVDPGESLRLEVEVTPFDSAFADTPTASSVPVPSGGIATVTVAGLSDNAAYHWQARAVDQTRRAGPWAPFGSDPDSTADFRIALPPSRLVFSQAPATASAGSPMTPAVTVTVQDADGNTIASFTDTVAIVLESNPAGGTLMGTDTVQAASGVATFADLSIERASAGYALQARYGQLTVTSAAFTVTAGAVSTARSTVTVSPTTITAGTQTSTITVTARDAYGNTVSGATVVLGATGTGNTVAQPAGPTSANGVATGTLRSTVAGTKTVSATISGVAVTQKPTVTVKAGAVSAARSTVTAAPTTITAGIQTSTITVTARDANGNPVSGATIVLAATGTGNTLTQPTAATNASGVATGTLRSTVAGAKTVSAKINGVAVTQTAVVTVN
jgi:hypothetical protein